jgi:hypothetical protein
VKRRPSLDSNHILKRCELEPKCFNFNPTICGSPHLELEQQRLPAAKDMLFSIF